MKSNTITINGNYINCAIDKFEQHCWPVINSIDFTTIFVFVEQFVAASSWRFDSFRFQLWHMEIQRWPRSHLICLQKVYVRRKRDNLRLFGKETLFALDEHKVTIRAAETTSARIYFPNHHF